MNEPRHQTTSKEQKLEAAYGVAIQDAITTIAKQHNEIEWLRSLLQEALGIHSRDVFTTGWAERARKALSGTGP